MSSKVSDSKEVFVPRRKTLIANIGDVLKAVAKLAAEEDAQAVIALTADGSPRITIGGKRVVIDTGYWYGTVPTFDPVRRAVLPKFTTREADTIKIKLK